MFHFSDSEPEELPSAWPPSVAFSTLLREDGRIVLVPISRRGEVSESEEKAVMVGGGGEPSDFFDKNPAWKRLERGLRSIEDCGGVGTGEDPLCSASGTGTGAE